VTNLTGKSRTIPKLLLAIVAAAAAITHSGCAPETTITKPSLPKPVAIVDRVALLMPESAVVNMDGKPGYDGVVAQIMLFQKSDRGIKSVLGSGDVDVLIFEGRRPNRLDDAPAPFFTWTFTSDELARHIVGQYNALWGYSLQLQWDTAPRASRMWLVARYRPTSGPAVYSSPAEQRMPVKAPAIETN